MKKSMVTLAIISTLGLAGISLAQAAATVARGFAPGYGCGGYGYGAPAASREDFETREKFYAETTDLRRQLFDKRNEYVAALNQEPVDSEATRKLATEIADLRQQIGQLAQERGVYLGGPEYCLGPYGYYEGAEGGADNTARTPRFRRGNYGAGHWPQMGWMMDI